MKKSLIILLLVSVTFAAVAQRFGKTLKNTPGIVSYTYRNSFQKDVALTLDTIKALGITDIEFSNLFGKTAAELRALLDARGLHCSSFGVSYDDLNNKTREVGSNAKTLGASFVRVAWIPHEGKTVDAAFIKNVADQFNAAGKILKDEFNLSFCYHNHGFEFVPYEKGTLFDYLVASTDPAYVNFELDILWAFHPGQDPAQLLRKYGKRFKLMHVKDLRKGVKGDFTGGTSPENDVALGTGQINIAEVIKAAQQSAIEHYYIEDESSSVKTQVPQSLKYLKSL
jgi:sugar phosphate isomerase/epimerase